MSDAGFNQSEKMLNDLEKRIHKEYEQASKEMAEKVDAYFAKFKSQDEAKREQYENGEISKKEYTEWRQRKMATGKRYTEMRDTLAKDLTNTDRIAMKMVNQSLPDVYALNMNYGTYQIEKETKINTSFTLYNHAAVERLIKENPNLLPMNPQLDIPKDLRWNQQHINSAITQGILQGKSIPDIAKDLQRVTGMDENAAIRNARTAMTGAQNAGRFDSIKRAQARGIGVKKGWLAILDSRTRDSHVGLDGEVVNVDETFPNGLMYPGDTSNYIPEEIYNCRCRLTTEYDKYKTDWSNPALRNTTKFKAKSYDEWKKAAKDRIDKKNNKMVAKSVAQKAVAAVVHTEAYKTLVDNIVKYNNIDYREVEDLEHELTDAEIIEKLGGGDLTKGSCSSLSYAYIGNKCGYDVYDFRDGSSRSFFASTRTEQLIRNLDGIDKQVFVVKTEATDIAKKLKELDLPIGKEYRLSCGRHAAIIRNTEKGYEYLELQSATGNGWVPFEGEKDKLVPKGIVDGKFVYEKTKVKTSMKETLKNRFGCRVSRSNSPLIQDGQLALDSEGRMIIGTEMELTAVDSYKGNAEFKEILGYINTAPDKQRKGAKGYAK